MGQATTEDDVRAEQVAALVVQEKPKKRWVSYIWDTFDKSPQERRFLFKLDAAILTFASLGMTSTKSLSVEIRTNMESHRLLHKVP
jgi:MFS transporter, ACS family, pantothenate transporter